MANRPALVKTEEAALALNVPKAALADLEFRINAASGQSRPEAITFTSSKGV